MSKKSLVRGDPGTYAAQRSVMVEKCGKPPLRADQIHPAPKITETYSNRHFVISNPNGLPSSISKRIQEYVELPDREFLNKLASEEFTSEQDLLTVIKSYTPELESAEGLDQLLAGYFPTIRREHFFTTTLPFIQSMLKKTHLLFRNCKIPILKQNENFMITLSQDQACCILANAFMCTWPHKGARAQRENKETSKLNRINFTNLLNLASPEVRTRRRF